ncbi:hypothetical protein [Streptomyces sp. NBC_01006]|uniref:hypothetical protein n=1 Tax=Streptomyces sp. NBC_01006 TaxID=2903716 RepID=UPI0038649A68|nr:hypothetical protein OG509_25350 [Streptomyces sp. NBC_01006]
MTETTSEQQEPAGEPESVVGTESESDVGPTEQDEQVEQVAVDTADEPETESEPEAATPPEEPEPEAEPEAEAEPEDQRLGKRLRGQLRTLALAGAGVALSAVVAAVVSAYLDIWSVREPPPGAPRITAASEVWWDLLSDHHLVRTAPGSTYDKEPLLFGDAQDTLAHMVTEGGADAGRMRIRLILTNFTRTPATITSVRARIERTHPAPTGPLFQCGGPQGSSEVSRVVLDLSTPQRPAMEQDPEGRPTGQYPSTKVQVAAQGDPAYFDVEVGTDNATGPSAVAYEFVLDVAYTQGDRQQHLLVDNAGRPFVLAQGVEGLSQGFRCNATGWSALGQAS